MGTAQRHEDAVDLEAEVVVEAGGPVALDDEAAGADRAGGAGLGGRRRLGGLREVALAAVFLEGHGDECDALAPVTC